MNQRGALDQFVARRRQKSCPCGFAPTQCPDAPDALQRHRDRPRRTDLNHQIDRSDVDAKFQRCGRNHRPQFARLQPRLRIQSQRPRQAAVMRQHHIFAQPLRQRMRNALRQPPRIDEHQRRSMTRNMPSDAVVDLRPHFAGRHRAQFVIRNFDRQTPSHADGRHPRSKPPETNTSRPLQ